MSITIAPPPPGGEEAVRDGVNSLLTMRLGEHSDMADADGYAGVAVAAPHPVYTAGVEDVLAGTLPASAQLSGWRYIVLGGDRALAAAEVRPERGAAGDVAGASFSALNRGPFVEGTVRGVATAEGLDEVRAGDYELRLLHLPSLYTVAIWLHGGEGRDLFIPLDPAPRGLRPFSVYTAGELSDSLRALAEARRAEDEVILPQTGELGAEDFGFSGAALRGAADARDARATVEKIELLGRLPEDERTGYYDAVVAPLVEEFSASVRADDPESLFRWLQLQSSALDWAVEGISEVTYELHRQAPEAVEAALSRLQPEQRVRVRWLLNEFGGEENLPPAVIARDELARANILRRADEALRDGPAADTGIFGRFVGTETFTSSRGFPVVRGTFTVLAPDGGEAGVYASNNGGGARNFRMRNGPIPPGVYRVSNHRPNRTTAGMVHEGVGYSFDLDPADGTRVFGRSLFRIHPDANPLGTNGCVGVRENAARLRECERNIAELLRRRDGAFKILVQF